MPAAWLRFVQDSLTRDESGAPGPELGPRTAPSPGPATAWPATAAAPGARAPRPHGQSRNLFWGGKCTSLSPPARVTAGNWKCSGDGVSMLASTVGVRGAGRWAAGVGPRVRSRKGPQGKRQRLRNRNGPWGPAWERAAQSREGPPEETGVAWRPKPWAEAGSGGSQPGSHTWR